MEDGNDCDDSGPAGAPVAKDEDNAWEDIEDGVEVDDKEMEQLMDFAYVPCHVTIAMTLQQPIDTLTVIPATSGRGGNVSNDRPPTGIR